jgi:hypothetical protein
MRVEWTFLEGPLAVPVRTSVAPVGLHASHQTGIGQGSPLNVLHPPKRRVGRKYSQWAIGNGQGRWSATAFRTALCRTVLKSALLRPDKGFSPWNIRNRFSPAIASLHLHVTSSPQPSACAAAPSPADSDYEVPIPRFSHRTALVSCYGDAEVPLPSPGVSCLSSSPSPPIVRPQPALQAGGPLGYG